MRKLYAVVLVSVLLPAAAAGQRAASPTEIKRAEHDIPQLMEVLHIEPGMDVADVGAGFGAMTIVLAKRLAPSGRVYATDLAAAQLAALREAVSRERLENVTVIEGAAASTNLPDDCCHAIFMRDVYHHITEPDAFNRSLFAALKPGGLLAIVDFPPRPGSKVPAGVNGNRSGHGITPALVIGEVAASGLTHVKTIDAWPPGDDRRQFFLVLFQKPQAAGTTPHAADGRAEQEIRESERQFNDARARADTATLDRLLADGWTITHGDGTIDTKTQYLADLRSGLRKFDYVKVEDVAVRLYGDTAVATGTTDSRVLFKGKPTGGPLRFTRVYVKRDGRWQMVVSHATRRQVEAAATPK